jgi:hypothetical protein
MQFYIHKHGDNGDLYQIKNAHDNKCVRTSGKKLKMHDCEGRAKSDKWSLLGTNGHFISFEASLTEGKWCPRVVKNQLEIGSKTRCNGPNERFKVLKK